MTERTILKNNLIIDVRRGSVICKGMAKWLTQQRKHWHYH